jgi:hypothetical protein
MTFPSRSERAPGHYFDDLLGYACGQVAVLRTELYHGMDTRSDDAGRPHAADSISFVAV